MRVFDAATRQPLAHDPAQGLVSARARDRCRGHEGLRGVPAFGQWHDDPPGEPGTRAARADESALPPAAADGLIVAANDPRIAFTVLDHDVAEIDAATLAVTRYFSGVGTNLFDVAVQPGRRETVGGEHRGAQSRALRAGAARARGRSSADAARLRTGAADGLRSESRHRLRAAAQSRPRKPPRSRSRRRSCSPPTARRAWVAAFGSDRVARISAATGAVLVAHRTAHAAAETSRADARPARARAAGEPAAALRAQQALEHDLRHRHRERRACSRRCRSGSHDPHAGRRSAKAAAFSSTRGSPAMAPISCATCHLDADRDGLAWDLGDPGGEMATVMGANLVDRTIRRRARARCIR